MACVGALPRVAVLVALVSGLFAGSRKPALAQSAPSTPAPAAPPAAEPKEKTEPVLPSDPERVRRGLERPSALRDSVARVEQVDGTTYRVTVTQKPFDVWSYWGDPETAVSSNVRTWYFSNWHHEYLRMVTPEAGRRAALYPTGMVPIMPALQAVANALRNASRARAQRQAKEEVQEALEEFFRAHPEARVAAPSPPDKPPVP